MNEALPYEVVQGPGESGRIAVASRPLRPGEIVLAERPVVCVAAPGRDVCDDCLEPIRAGDVLCASCIGGGGGSTPLDSRATPSVRLSAKLVWRRCSGYLGREHALEVDSLVHHEELFAGEYARDQEEDCTQVVKLAAGMASGRSAAGSPNTTTEDGLRILSDAMAGSGRIITTPLKMMTKQELGRVHVNAITTCDGSGTTGLGLFPSAAMFNHSCSPNLQAWWRGSKLEFRCTKSVASGEELCFSYIPIDQPSMLRREQLRHSWFFTCLCQRCVSGKWDAELAGLRCPVPSCAGAVPPPWKDPGASCNHCGCVLGADCLAPEADQPFEQQRSISSPSPLLAEAKKRLRTENVGAGGGGEKGRLLRARRDFGDGVEAYMREDAEAALVTLTKSLAVQESILHPFNKELLRTLRFASYAAVATSKWVEARSFLLRWLHPMETMFGAAEVWDIAAMRIDVGLVTDKLHSTNSSGAASVSPPSSPTATSSQIKPSPQETASPQETGGDGIMHPAAFTELAQGLRWIWICLGKDCGLAAENAALEACLSETSRSLLQAAAAV